MSVHKTAAGTWRVRWRENGGLRSRTFDRRSDAQRFDAEVTRLRQLGPLGLPQLERGAITVDEFVAGPFAEYLATATIGSTRRRYFETYRLHVAPYLGDVPLREVSVERLRGWQAGLLRAGAGVESIRKANTLIGSILQRAVEDDRLSANPQRLVRKPRPVKTSEARPLAPQSVEALRRHLLDPEPVTVAGSRPGQRKRRGYQVERRDPLTCRRDAALVSVLAYAGLRPFEALRLTWRHVQDRTLLVYARKTNTTRTVRLLAPLAADLAAWRLACGNPDGSQLVFPSAAGEVWAERAYQSWRRRTFDSAVEAIGRGDATPYTLRHSFASLLLHEGRNVVYVARQLGHSASMTLHTYAHVMDELEDAPNLPAEDAIRDARATCVPSEFPLAGSGTAS